MGWWTNVNDHYMGGVFVNVMRDYVSRFGGRLFFSNSV